MKFGQTSTLSRGNHAEKNIFIGILAIVLFNSCQHFSETRKFDIDLEFNESSVTSILFETKNGCSKTNFKFTEAFFKEIKLAKYNCFIASNFKDFENTIKRYLEMDFFDTITEEYFSKNNLVVLVFGLDDGDTLKNGRFSKGNNNKYLFEVDIWYKKLFTNKCSYYKVLILEIGK